MTELSEHIALEINGQEVGLSEVVRSAKWRGQLSFLRDAINTVIIRQEAERRGLTVPDDELQQAADEFRISHDLHDAEATEQWLTANYLTVEEWERLLEEEVLARKLRDLQTNGRVEQHFAENRLSFEAATVSQLIADSEDVARELRSQIVEEGVDFHALARQYSKDEATRLAGGYMGRIRRTDMEAAVEASVFGAKPGKVVGPLKTDAGWILAKIEALHPAQLNDATRASIKQTLFEEWLAELRRRARIRIPLLKHEE